MANRVGGSGGSRPGGLALLSHGRTGLIFKTFLAVAILSGLAMYSLVAAQSQQPSASGNGPSSRAIVDRFHRGPRLALSVAIPIATPIGPSFSELEEFVPPRGTVHPRLESTLSQLVTAERSGQNLRTVAQWKGIPLLNNRLQAVIETESDATAQVASAIEAMGLTVQSTYRHLVQVQAPVESLTALADLPHVRFVRRPLDLYPQEVLSEGLRLLGTMPWHEKGFKGQGAKVAVVDLGFLGYGELLGSELPEQVQAESFIEDVFTIEVGTYHGTAVAELLIDVAPEASLYLVAISTEVELGNAVDWLVEEGVQIISFSVGALAAPSDGTSVIDGIVDRARDKGILWVNAAGNYGSSHWQGTFNDGAGDGWHEFEDGSKLFPVEIGANEIAVFILTWNDWPASSQDYGFYLFWGGVDGSLQLISFSDSSQTGDQPPLESIFSFFVPRGQYHLAIKRHEANQDAQFHLFSLVQEFPERATGGSIISPASARGALAVGATNGFDQIQTYSSRGPTTDGRTKPDLMAPDSVTTVTFGDMGFPGTSASAPYVAGAAALVLSAYPSMEPRELQEYLEARALRIGQPGENNVYGSGRLQLGIVPEVPPVPVAIATPTPTPTGTPPDARPARGTPRNTATPTPTVVAPTPTGVAWPSHFGYVPIAPKLLPLNGLTQ